jgi:ribosome maturation protein Sdo1
MRAVSAAAERALNLSENVFENVKVGDKAKKQEMAPINQFYNLLF